MDGPAARTSAAIRVGEPAPDLRLPAHDGRTIALADLRGQRVVLAFFLYAFTDT